MAALYDYICSMFFSRRYWKNKYVFGWSGWVFLASFIFPFWLFHTCELSTSTSIDRLATNMLELKMMVLMKVLKSRWIFLASFLFPSWSFHICELLTLTTIYKLVTNKLELKIMVMASIPELHGPCFPHETVWKHHSSHKQYSQWQPWRRLSLKMALVHQARQGPPYCRN